MKSFVVAFLLPPGFAIVLAMVALYLLVKRKKQKAGCIVLMLSIFVGWVFSTEATGRLLTVGLLSQIEHRTDFDLREVDMIAVITGGMRYSGKETGWQPTQDSFDRMAAAVDIQSRLNSRIPILVSGGKTMGPHYPSESAVIKARFDKDNARILPIILEEISTNTYENALQSAHIINRRGAKRVLLVTSEEHMLRSLAAFRGRGIDPIPLRVYTMDRGPLNTGDFLPSFKGVEVTAKAMYEMFGIVEYILTERVRVADVFYKTN